MLRAQSTQIPHCKTTRQLGGKVQFGEKIRRGGKEEIEKKYSWIHGTEGEAWYSLHLKGFCHEMNIFLRFIIIYRFVHAQKV